MKNRLGDAIVYQIYPTSFYDSNGDGIGDLRGITEKLEYVKELGVDIIWLNPFYTSPFKDGGYDISDYYSVDEKFGTMSDFETLIAKADSLGLKICIDLVIGHTSWEHEWFKKSREKGRNEYSDYYIWTNSCFNTYKEKTISGLYDRDGCFYTNYYAHQPALNFGFQHIDAPDTSGEPYDGSTDWQMHYKDPRLAPLREEIIRIMRFWLKKGVAGFRVDMAASLIKNNTDSSALKWLWNIFFESVKKDYPDVVFISEWGDPRVAVGEIGFNIDYMLHENPHWNSLCRCEEGLNLAPKFINGKNYFSEEGKGNIESFLTEAEDLWRSIDGKGYFAAISGSHDEIRLATEKSTDELKTIFAFLLTFKHIPFIYYGDEIGMIHNYNVSRDGGYIRTGARTPMQWSNGKNRGFSESDTVYLPTDERENCSVESQINDANSVLNTVKKLIRLRKCHTCLSADGEFRLISCTDGGYPLVYERSDHDGKIAVIINPSREKKRLEICYNSVLMSHNCIADENTVDLHGIGYAILKIDSFATAT